MRKSYRVENNNVVPTALLFPMHKFFYQDVVPTALLFPLHKIFYQDIVPTGLSLVTKKK